MRFSHRGKLGRVLVAAGATVPLIVGTGAFMQSSPVSADTLSSANYTGRSCAIQLSNIKLLNSPLIPDQCIGDSGQVPAAGGTATAPKGPANVAGLLGATVVDSSAGGANGVSNASTRVTGVGILPAGSLTPGLNLPPIAGTLPINAPGVNQALLAVEVVAADTSVDCNGPSGGVLVGNPPGLGIASPSGTGAATLVQGVSLNGSSLTSQITGQPNQTLDLGVVKLTLNEQNRAPGNTSVANAIRIDLNLPGVLMGTITIGHAESDLTDCVFSAPPKTPGNPPTGSLTAPGDLTGVSGSAGLRTAVVPAGLTAIVAAGLMIGRRRRRPTAPVDDRQS